MKDESQKIPVKAAELHTPIRIAGVSEMNLNPSKMVGIVMHYTPHCLLVKFRGETAIVPHANVKFALIESEAEKPKMKQ